jgi:hypothetical protein
MKIGEVVLCYKKKKRKKKSSRGFGVCPTDGKENDEVMECECMKSDVKKIK